MEEKDKQIFITTTRMHGRSIFQRYVYATLLGLDKPPRPQVRKVIFNDPATIIYWTDGTKTVVKCQKGDTYNKETGFVVAYLKKLLGNGNQFNKEIKKWVGQDEECKNTTKNYNPVERAYDLLLGIKPKDAKSATSIVIESAIGYLGEALE